MKRLGRIIIPAFFLSLLAAGTASATPSTTYWTPATSDVQPFNVWHIGVDNYFRLYQTQQDLDKGQGMALPTDVGLTVGVLPFEKLNMEVGTDYLAPAVFAHPALRSMGSSILFNAKLGTPEGAFLGSWFPAFNLGIFNVGTKSQVTSMNIVDFLVGKTLGQFGRIHGGGYYGNPGSVLMNKNGCVPGATVSLGCAPGQTADHQNTGGMVGYDYGFWPVKDKEGNEYNKWVFAADYASGKNYIGGGGFGIYRYFTKDISLLTGPVWFNDHAINGQWKWTVQLDINF
ncbi:MAG TPA: hypothetical protein VE201_00540 [Nitrospirales bacterium]|nr:hypothetical protein [Nitrospirales bacterium]